MPKVRLEFILAAAGISNATCTCQVDWGKMPSLDGLEAVWAFCLALVRRLESPHPGERFLSPSPPALEAIGEVPLIER